MTVEEAKKQAKVLIGVYMKDKTQENLDKLINHLFNTVVEIPALLPPNVDREELRKQIESGNPQIPADVRPVPSFLKNGEGEIYLPVYTERNEIPKEPRFDVIITIPFIGCVKLQPGDGNTASGIAFNPFSDNLVFKKPLVESITKHLDAQAAKIRAAQANGEAPNQQPQVSREQYELMMTQRAEFYEFPKALFEGGNDFMNKVCDDREPVVNELFKRVYQNQKDYPFAESDFSVMALNIGPELLMARVDVPQPKVKAQWCYRVYLTINPETQEAHYYTIERSKEKGVNILGEITKELVRKELGEAPVEGAELSYVIDLAQGKNPEA